MQLVDESIWELFIYYANHLSANGVESGIDVYGTEQRTSLAASLTIAHYLKQLTETTKANMAQNAAFQRANKYTVSS